MRRWLVGIAAFAACRGSHAPVASEPPPRVAGDARAPDAQESEVQDVPEEQPQVEGPLTVTLDGAPVRIASIISYRRAGTITTVASTRALDCAAEWRGGWRGVAAGEVRFEIEWTWALKPDGSSQPQLNRLVYDGSSIDTGRWLAGSGDASSGTPTSITIAFTNTNATAQHTLHVAGTLRSIGCAVHDPPVVLPPAQAATIEIAGHRLPVRRAELLPHDDYADATLLLTTGDESCDPHHDDLAPSPLSVSLQWLNPNDPEVGRIAVYGTAIGSMGSGLAGGDRIDVTPRPHGAGAVTVHGTATVSDYPVRIDGTVQVQVCPPR